MKACLFFLAVLAAFVTCNDAASIHNADDTSSNLQEGTYSPTDRLLHLYVPCIKI